MESLGLDVATIALMEDWRDKVEKFGEWKRQEEICASVINHWSGGHDTEHGEVRKDELTRWKGEHDTARKELEGAKASMMSAKDRLDQRVLAVTRESRDSKKRLNSEIAKLTQLLSRKSREGTNQDGENAVVEPVVEEDDPHPKTCGTVEGTGNVGGGAVEKRGGCDGEQPSPSSADGNVQREGNGDVEAVESGNDTGVATSEEHDGGEGKQLSPPLADGNVEREGNGDVQAGGIGDGKTPSLPECSRKRVQRKMIGGADGDVGPSKRPKRAAAAAAAAVGATRLTTVRRASRKTAIAGDEEEEQADADAGEKCGHGNAVDDQEEEGDEDEEGGGSGHGFLPALLNGRKDESKTCYSDEVWEEMVHHFQGETVLLKHNQLLPEPLPLVLPHKQFQLKLLSSRCCS